MRCTLKLSPLVRARSPLKPFWIEESTARRVCRTRDEASAHDFDYIELLYTPRRRHSKLRHLRPVEF